MRIAKAAKTATRTGSNSALRPLPCICVYNLFPGAWAVWRLVLLSPLRHVESSQRCVHTVFGLCRVGYFPRSDNFPLRFSATLGLPLLLGDLGEAVFVDFWGWLFLRDRY
jgi:hypothetical protein